MIGPPLLCLEVSQSSDSLLVLNDVKKNLHLLPDSSNIASEWSRILGPLDADLFSCQSDDDDDCVDTSYHYDVDMVVIGLSHDGCNWADMCSFSRDLQFFKLVFQQNHRGTSNGFRGKFLEGNKSRPLWMLPQALVAKAFFGNLEFDLVVFGPEDTEKCGFEAQISRRLCDSILAAISDPDMPLRSLSVLNHLATAIRHNAGPPFTTFGVSDPKACSLILTHLQRLLSAEHHIFLIDLGCKSRSCTAGGSRIKTRRGLSANPEAVAPSSPVLNSSDWHDTFQEILEKHLNLVEVERQATFILADCGIEFTSPGRFMHWDHEACKAFKAAMGGKGASFFSFGLRQLANYDSRQMEFER